MMHGQITTRIELRNKFRHIISGNDTRMNRAVESMRLSRQDTIAIAELAAKRVYDDSFKGIPFERSFSNFLFDNREHLPIGNTPMLEKSKLTEADTILIDSSLLAPFIPLNGSDFRKCTNWFNASIIDFHGKRLMAYRMDAKPYCTVTKIAICENWENKDWVINEVLKLKTNRIAEDPRLFIFNDDLYLSYCDGYQMLQAMIDVDTLEVIDSYYIDKPDEKQTEKNWVFFESEKRLYALYSITPNIVYEIKGKEIEQVTDTTFHPFHWMQWGTPHGGTTPILHDGLFYTFFHSSAPLYYEDISRSGRQYFIGCYVFDSRLPFAPKFISKEPLFAATYVDNPTRLSNDIFVAFPCGQVREENGFLVSFGSNDFECRLIKFTDELLKENLIPA